VNIEGVAITASAIHLLARQSARAIFGFML
jgi:hypothetical protein